MGFKSIRDLPLAVGNPAGWSRTERVAYFRDPVGRWKANVIAVPEGFSVRVRRGENDWTQHLKAYTTLDDALLIAEALCALNG